MTTEAGPTTKTWFRTATGNFASAIADPQGAGSAHRPVGAGSALGSCTESALRAARSREVGVATEMLLTKAEQVSDDGAHAAGLRL